MATKKEVVVCKASKSLSMCLLIDRVEFAALSAARQTEILALTAGKPVIFIDSFNSLRNRKNIISKLLKGEDATMELEFNDIILTEEEKEAFTKVQPIITKLDESLTSDKYQWVYIGTQKDARDKLDREGIKVTHWNVMAAGYEITSTLAKKITKLCLEYWKRGETERRKICSSKIHYETRDVFCHGDKVHIGCQEYNRSQIEALAVYYNIPGPE